MSDIKGFHFILLLTSKVCEKKRQRRTRMEIKRMTRMDVKRMERINMCGFHIHTPLLFFFFVFSVGRF